MSEQWIAAPLVSGQGRQNLGDGMTDTNRAFEFAGGFVVQRVFRDPDNMSVARLRDFLRQRGLAATRFADR